MGKLDETALWDDNDSLESTLRALAPLRGDHVYLSGSARFVQQFERRCFMHGASRSDIHKEMFLDFSQTTAQVLERAQPSDMNEKK